MIRPISGEEEDRLLRGPPVPIDNSEEAKTRRAQETLSQFIDPAEFNYTRALRAMLEFEKDERTRHDV